MQNEFEKQPKTMLVMPLGTHKVPENVVLFGGKEALTLGDLYIGEKFSKHDCMGHMEWGAEIPGCSFAGPMFSLS